MFFMFSFLLLFLFLVLVNADVEPIVSPLQSPDRYIVVFKPDIPVKLITNQIQKFKSHAKNSSVMDNKITANEFNSIGKFRWYSALFDTQEFETYASDASIHYWIKDDIFSMQEFIQPDPPSWGLDRIDQRASTDNQYRFASSRGKGVSIYIMDSGIREDHEDIVGRVTIGKTVVGDNPGDINGHGTFVAGVCCGTKYGVAKNAEIVSVKILDDEGNGRLSDVLTGLQWVVEQHMKQENPKTIINLSLGALHSQVTNEAIEQSVALGIHFAIAAGNYGEDACLYSPGSAQGPITVGAIDEDDSVAIFSNFGKCVDIFAPGININSIWPSSKDATNTLSGTSMAAPHVAGTMAIFLSQKDYTPKELANHIKAISSLVTQNTSVEKNANNENKTVLDNAIDQGYRVEGRLEKKAKLNILYSSPNDGEEYWLFGQTLNGASTPSYSILNLIIMTLTIIISPYIV